VTAIETPSQSRTTQAADISSLALTLFRLRQWLTQPSPYLGFLGVASLVLAWYLLTEFFNVPRFNKLPGPVAVWQEFTSPSPTFGISIYTPAYYMHIFWSIWRVLQAFFWATILGVPLGLFMGWKRTFRDYAFPILEIVRPIPVLAWVPVAILIFAGIASREAPVIFLAFLATFFATVLNTMLGVESIDEVYFRAARCLGSKPRHVFFPRRVARRSAIHLYRAADRCRCRVVFAGGGRNDFGRVRARGFSSGIHTFLSQFSGDHHRNADAWRRGLRI
jgi:NitT/TauT family transport system permease protein